MSRHMSKVLLVPILLLLYWQLLVMSGLVSAYLLPAPLTVARAAVDMWQSGVLPKHIGTSLMRVVQGFSCSASLGLLLAAAVVRFPLLDTLLAAPLSLLRMIPPLAMTPLLIIWLGIGAATPLAIIILASVFPVFLNARDGLQRVALAHRELAYCLHLSAWRYGFWVVLPGALPSIVTGLRLAFGYSWRALIGAELIAVSSGLGYLILDAQELMRSDAVIVGILCIGIIGWLLDAVFCRVVRILLQRRFAEIGR